MELVEAGKIRPVIYKGVYRGLESVEKALEALRTHRAWGRAVLRISEEEDEERAKL